MKKHVFTALLIILLFTNGKMAENETTFMAKYLVSLTRYIEWPSTMKTGDFKIGVIGNFEVYKAISEETMGSGIQHRNVDILNLAKIENISITNLNILILSKSFSTPENIRKALTAIGSKPTLLVTEKNGSLEYGSAINFIIKENKLRFEINKTNATKNGIQISSELDVFAFKVER